MHFSDKPGPPGAPEPSEVTSTDCELAWRPPDQDGGTPITGYYVERAQTRSQRWVRLTRDPVPQPRTKVGCRIDSYENWAIIDLIIIGVCYNTHFPRKTSKYYNLTTLSWNPNPNLVNG